MTLKYYAAVDLSGLPVSNLVVQQLASDPSPTTATKGQLWINTTSGQLKTHDGTTVYVLAGAASFVTSAMIVDGTIVNADVAAGAGIVASKLDSASFNTQVQTSRLDQMAAPTAAVGVNSQKVTSLADPTLDTDAATKQYVDAQTSSQDWKISARFATAAALPANTYSNGASGVGATLTATANAALTVDGSTPAVADRILVKNEVTGANNGVYIVTQVGDVTHPYILTRTTDADDAAVVTAGLTIASIEGTANTGAVWLLTTHNPITIGTTALVFTQINAPGVTYTASTGLTLAGNAFSLTNPVTVALGGTGSASAAGARTGLNVPQQGVVVTIGALTAGVELLTNHGLGAVSQNFSVLVRDATTKATVGIAARGASTTQFGVTSDVTLGSGVLEAVITPVA